MSEGKIMEKRVIKEQAAHGELLIERVEGLPESGIARKELPPGEHLVLAHSDSGHHHYIDSKHVPRVEYHTVNGARDDTCVRAFLVVTTDNKAVLSHKKPPPYDHKDIYLPKGIYRIKRRLAYNPWTETWGRTSD